MVLLKQLIYGATFLGVIFVFDLAFLGRYSRQINDINTKNLQEFAVIFGYFRIFIRNGYSVYSALKEIINFANPRLKKLLKELVSEIDDDKTVQPFVKFAKQFNEIIVEEMMISIYQMIDQGENSDQLTHCNIIFDEVSKNRNKGIVEQKEKSLSNMSVFPLAGAGLITIALTISTLTILVDLIDVV